MYGNTYTTNLPIITNSDTVNSQLYYNDFTTGTYTIDSTQISNVLNIFQNSNDTVWESTQSNPYGSVLPLGTYSLESSSSDAYKAFDGNPLTEWSSRIYQNIVDYGSNINVSSSSNVESVYKAFNTGDSWVSDSTYGFLNSPGYYWLYGSNNNSLWISNPTYGFNYSTRLSNNLSRISQPVYGGVSSNIQSLYSSIGSFDGNTWTFYSNLYGGRLSTTTYTQSALPFQIQGEQTIKKIDTYILNDNTYYIEANENIKSFIFYPTTRNTQGVYYSSSNGTDGYTNLFYDVVNTPTHNYFFRGFFFPQENGDHTFTFIKNNQALINGTFSSNTLNENIITISMSVGQSYELVFRIENATTFTLLAQTPSGVQFSDYTGYFGTAYNTDFPTSINIVGELYSKFATFTTITSYPSVNSIIYPSTNGTNRIAFNGTLVTDNYLNISSNIFKIIQKDDFNIYGYFVDSTNQLIQTPYPTNFQITSFSSGTYTGELKSFETSVFSSNFNNILPTDVVVCNSTNPYYSFNRYRIVTTALNSSKFDSIFYERNITANICTITTNFSAPVTVNEFQVVSENPLNYIEIDGTTYTNFSNTNVFRKNLLNPLTLSTFNMQISNTVTTNVTSVQFFDSVGSLLNTDQVYIGDGSIGQYIVSNIFPCVIGIYDNNGNTIQRFKTINVKNIGNINGDWYQIKFPSTVNLSYCLLDSLNASNVIVLTSVDGYIWDLFSSTRLVKFGGTQKINGTPAQIIYVRVIVQSVFYGDKCTINYVHFYDSNNSRIDQDISQKNSIIYFPNLRGGYYKGTNKIGEYVTLTSNVSFTASYIQLQGVVPENFSIFSGDTFIDSLTSYSQGYYKLNNFSTSNTYSLYVTKTSDTSRNISMSIKLYDAYFIQQASVTSVVPVSVPGKYIVSDLECFDSNSYTYMSSTLPKSVSIEFQYPVTVNKFTLLKPFFSSFKIGGQTFTITDYDVYSNSFTSPVTSNIFTLDILGYVNGYNDKVSLGDVILYSEYGRVNEPLSNLIQYVSSPSVYGGYLNEVSNPDSFNVNLQTIEDVRSVTLRGNVIPTTFTVSMSDVSFDTIEQKPTLLTYTTIDTNTFSFSSPCQITSFSFSTSSSVNWTVTGSYDGTYWFPIYNDVSNGGEYTVTTDYISYIRFTGSTTITNPFVFYGYQNIVSYSPLTFPESTLTSNISSQYSTKSTNVNEYKIFNNSSINTWISNQTYDLTGNYIGTVSTSGIYGEYIQLFSQTPKIIYSYTITLDSTSSWYLLSSSDEISWNVIDYQSYSTGGTYYVNNSQNKYYRIVFSQSLDSTVTVRNIKFEEIYGYTYSKSDIKFNSSVYDSLGNYRGNTNTEGIYGEWFELDMPDYPFAMTQYSIPDNGSPGNLQSWTIVGSNDGFSWTILDSRTSYTSSTIYLTNTTIYSTYRFILQKTSGNPIAGIYITNENGFLTIKSTLQEESYDTGTGNYKGTTVTDGYNGKWFQYTFETPVSLYAYILNTEPQSYVVLGSNDEITWNFIDSSSVNKVYNKIGQTPLYTYIRFVVLKTVVNTKNNPIQTIYVNPRSFDKIEFTSDNQSIIKYYTLKNPTSTIWTLSGSNDSGQNWNIIDSRTSTTPSNIYYVNSNVFYNDYLLSQNSIGANLYGYSLLTTITLSRGFSTDFTQRFIMDTDKQARYYNFKVYEIPSSNTNSYSIDSVELYKQNGIKVFPYQNTFSYGTTELFGQYFVRCSTGKNVDSLFTSDETNQIYIQEKTPQNLFTYPGIGFVQNGSYGFTNGPGTASIEVPYPGIWNLTSDSDMYINGENVGPQIELPENSFLLTTTSSNIKITEVFLNVNQTVFSSSISGSEFGEYVEITLPCATDVSSYTMEYTGTTTICVGSNDGKNWTQIPTYGNIFRIIAKSDPVIFGSISLYNEYGRINSFLDSSKYITSPTFYGGLSNSEYLVYNFPTQNINAYSVSGTMTSWSVDYKTDIASWVQIDVQNDSDSGYYNIPLTAMNGIRFKPTKKKYSQNPSVVIDSFKLYSNVGYTVFPMNIGTFVKYFPASAIQEKRATDIYVSGGTGDFNNFKTSKSFNELNGEYIGDSYIVFIDSQQIYGEVLTQKMKTGKFKLDTYRIDSDARSWLFFGILGDSYEQIDTVYRTKKDGTYIKTFTSKEYDGFGILIQSSFNGDSFCTTKLDIFDENGTVYYNNGGRGNEYVSVQFDIPQSVYSVRIKFNDCYGSYSIENSNDGQNWTTFDKLNSYTNYKVTFDSIYDSSSVDIDRVILYSQQGYELVPNTITSTSNFTPLPVIQTSSLSSFKGSNSIITASDYNPMYIGKEEYFNASNPTLNLQPMTFDTDLYSNSYINTTIPDYYYSIFTSNVICTEASNGKYGKSLPIQINIENDGQYDVNNIYPGNYDSLNIVSFGGGYDESGNWVLGYDIDGNPVIGGEYDINGNPYTFPGSITNNQYTGQYYDYNAPVNFNFIISSVNLSSSNIISYTIFYTNDGGITYTEWTNPSTSMNGFRIIVWKCIGNITGTLEIQTDTNGYPGVYTEDGNITTQPYDDSGYDSIGQWALGYDDTGNISLGGEYDKDGNFIGFQSDWTRVGDITYVNSGQVIYEQYLDSLVTIGNIELYSDAVKTYIIHGSNDKGASWTIIQYIDNSGQPHLSNIYNYPPLSEEIDVNFVNINAFKIQVMQTDGDPFGSFIFTLNSDKRAYIGNYDSNGNISYASGHDALGIYVGGYDINGDKLLGGQYDIHGNPYTFPGALLFTQNSVINEYPPIELTSDDTLISGQAYGNGLYSISSSTSYYFTYTAFDKDDSDILHSWSSLDTYQSGTGEYTGTFETNDIFGEWIQINFPENVDVTRYSIESYNVERSPVQWTLFGSTDGIHWNVVDSQNSQQFTGGNQVKTYSVQVETKSYYRYFRLVIEKVNQSTNGFCTISEIKYFGSDTHIISKQYPHGIPGNYSDISFPNTITFSSVIKTSTSPVYYVYRDENNNWTGTYDLSGKTVYSDISLIIPEMIDLGQVSLITQPLEQDSPPGNYNSAGIYELNGGYDILGQIQGNVLENSNVDIYNTSLRFNITEYKIDSSNVISWKLLGTIDNGRTWKNLDEQTSATYGDGPYILQEENNYVNGLQLVIHRINKNTNGNQVSISYTDVFGNNIPDLKKAYRPINDNDGIYGEYIDIVCNPCVLKKYGLLNIDLSLQSWTLIGIYEDGSRHVLVENSRNDTSKNIQVDISFNTLEFTKYRIIFTSASSGFTSIKIDDVYFSGPNGNYNKTFPNTQMTNTVSVPYPPIRTIVLPVTIQGFSYGNGFYYELYQNSTSPSFGTYNITGKNASVSMVFPYPIKITDYSLITSGPYTLSATNNDIFIDSLASGTSSDGSKIHISNTTKYSKYIFTFPDSQNQTITNLLYYGEFIYAPENPVVWFSDEKLNVSGNIPTSNFTIVYIDSTDTVYTIVDGKFSLIGFDVMKQTNILNLQNAKEYIVYNYNKTYNDVIRDVKYLMMKYL